MNILAGLMSTAKIKPFQALREVCTSGATKVLSSKRVVLVFSAGMLNVCLVAMTAAICYAIAHHPADTLSKINYPLVALYATLTVPVAGLAGFVYKLVRDEKTGEERIVAEPSPAIEEPPPSQPDVKS